jgi:O-antigen ligase
MLTKKNFYDYFIIFVISSLIFGTIQKGIVGQYLIVGLFCLPFALQEIIKTIHHINKKHIVLFLLIWLLYATVSLLWTIDDKGGYGNLWRLFWQIVMFLGVYNAAQKSNNPIQSVIAGWVALLCLTFPIAFWEIISGNHLEKWGDFNEGAMIYGAGATIERVFAAVTYMNLNSYVTLICSSLPFVLAGVFLLRKKILPLLVGLCASIILIINSSRGGIICLGIYFITFLWFYRKVQFRYKKLISTLFLTVIILVTFYYGEVLFNQIFGRLDSLRDNVFEDTARSTVLFLGLELLLDSNLFGWGVGSMQEAYRAAGSSLEFAHNFVLEFLVEYGVWLFIMWFVLYAKYIKNLCKNENIGLKFVGFAILFACIPWAIIDDSYLTHPFIWMYLASICILSQKGDDKQFITNL